MVALTVSQLRQFAPGGRPDILAAVADGESVLESYAITTPSRVCHFMAQIAHESAGFRTTEEYASGAAYEGRANLGNVKPGDGKRFKGRGLIQLTGRANYRTYGQKLGLDLEGNPTMAAQPALSLKIACEYWKAKGLNVLADRDDITGITRKINGGTNGLDDRKAYLAKAKKLWGEAPVVVPKSDEAVKDLQGDLVALGYDVKVDGFSGPKTEKAIRDVQTQAGIKVDGLAGDATKDAIAKRLERRSATGEPPADKTLLDALKTPEGIATIGGASAPIINAAANPGPLAVAIAIVVVIGALIGAYYLVKRMRRAEA